MRTIRLATVSARRRTAAALVDAAVVTAVVSLLWVAGVFPTDIYAAPPDRFGIDHLLELWIARPGAFLDPVAGWTLAWIAWHVGWVYLGDGQTPGCRLMRVRFLDKHADPIRSPQAGLRAVGHVLSVATLGLGWAWIWVSPARRSWPDIISGTYLIPD
jgi:uncharacterized RDD family membrane protein YckC